MSVDMSVDTLTQSTQPTQPTPPTTSSPPEMAASTPAPTLDETLFHHKSVGEFMLYILNTYPHPPSQTHSVDAIALNFDEAPQTLKQFKKHFSTKLAEAADGLITFDDDEWRGYLDDGGNLKPRLATIATNCKASKKYLTKMFKHWMGTTRSGSGSGAGWDEHKILDYYWEEGAHDLKVPILIKVSNVSLDDGETKRIPKWVSVKHFCLVSCFNLPHCFEWVLRASWGGAVFEKTLCLQILRDITTFREEALKQQRRTLRRRAQDAERLLQQRLPPSQIPTHIVQLAFEDALAKENPCPICSELITNRDEFILTPCGHYYCSACLSAWRVRSSECPSCRAEIPASSIPTLPAVANETPDDASTASDFSTDTEENEEASSGGVYGLYSFI